MIGRTATRSAEGFEREFRALFASEFERVFRVLHRLSGDADLASDLAQDGFVRLYQRGTMPNTPASWVISVSLNLFRNARTTERRRRRLLTLERGTHAHGDHARAPDDAVEASDARARVRTALDALPERERAMLLLKAEGYSYREIASALELHEASVGTLLARAMTSLRRGLHADDAS